jgi:hypothetical protein
VINLDLLDTIGTSKGTEDLKDEIRKQVSRGLEQCTKTSSSLSPLSLTPAPSEKLTLVLVWLMECPYSPLDSGDSVLYRLTPGPCHIVMPVLYYFLMLSGGSVRQGAGGVGQEDCPENGRAGEFGRLLMRL